MSKTIKVIDLLNKIANGEKVPKKIEYKNMNYKFATHPITGEKWYWRDNVDYWSELCIDRNILNYNEIKIIEEEQEIDIQEIQKFDEIRDISIWSNDTLSYNQREILSKVNKLIRAVKQLDNQINNK